MMVTLVLLSCNWAVIVVGKCELPGSVICSSVNKGLSPFIVHLFFYHLTFLNTNNCNKSHILYIMNDPHILLLLAVLPHLNYSFVWYY